MNTVLGLMAEPANKRLLIGLEKRYYCINDSKFSDRQVWSNSADPDQTAPQQSDQGLHCLPFCLHL